MAFPTLHTLNYEDLNDNFTLMANYMESVRDALAGDRELTLSDTTATPLVSALGAGDVVYPIEISLVNGDGTVLDWYNGKIKLAIAETDDGEGCTVAINPAAGEHDMVGGQLTVTVTMKKATWTANKTATLTVSAPSTATNAIITGVASATFVATVTADPIP